jgi:exoribonuclease R
MLTTKDYSVFHIIDTNIQFTGAKLANKCLPGDQVEWDIQKNQCKLVSRGNHSLIVGTLELTNKSKYGLTNRQLPMYLFTPYDQSYPHFIVGSSEKDVSRNIIALISFGEWTPSSTFPRGNLQTVLGHSGDFEAESQAIMWQACPWKYSSKETYTPMLNDNIVRTRISAYTKGCSQNHSKNDWSETYTFNIDPPGCRDVDDVFTFEQVPDGWNVTITISDVAAYVERGSNVDKMAEKISQTLYNNDGGVVRPMLPPQYSEEACSLLPGKESYGLSMSFIWNCKEQIITDIKWFSSVLKVDRSYTYEEFQMSKSSYTKPLEQIASYLADRHSADSHEWVEQMMLFYNREAGKLLKRAGQGVLGRHSKPNLERLEAFQKSGILELEKFAYSSAEYCLSTEAETVHYGLGTDAYAHASSPIRRYADLVNQRILKEIIKQEKQNDEKSINVYQMNRRGKAVKRFSRDMDFLKAISTSDTRFNAIIVEKKILDDKIKIKLYVRKWGRMVSTWFKSVSAENVVLSRDESREIDVTLYREVEIDCVFMPNARNWKERVVIQIV